MTTDSRGCQKRASPVDDDFYSSDEEYDDISLAEEESPPQKPFRLLDLPRENRNQIYNEILTGEVTFVETVEQVNPHGYAPKGYPVSHGGVRVNILQICSQVYQETKPALYSCCIPEFVPFHQDASTIRPILDFLENVVPPDQLKSILKLKLVVRESTTQSGVTTVGGVEGYGDDQEFDKLCGILAEKCQLRELEIIVSHANKSFITLPAHQRHAKSTQDTTFEIPLWVRSLSKVRNLRHLALYWEYPDTGIVGRTVNSAKLMRSTMLENGNKLKGGEGIITRFRHIREDQQHKKTSDRKLTLSMNIDKCLHSKGRHMRRVKVLPDRWCRTCGCFSAPEARYCLCGVPIGSRAIIPIIEEDATNPNPIKDQVLRHDRPWDRKEWGGRPLQEFLPHHVNEEDFHDMKAFAEVGFGLQLRYENDGYVDSDFGDTDSLISVHGWSDDEDDY